MSETTETEKAVVCIIGTVIFGYCAFQIVDFLLHWWIDLVGYAAQTGRNLK